MAELSSEIQHTSHPVASQPRTHAKRFWLAILISATGYVITLVGALMIHRQNVELVSAVCSVGVGIVLLGRVIDSRLKAIELRAPQLIFLLIGYVAIVVAIQFYSEGEFAGWNLRPADLAGICVITLIALVHLTSAMRSTVAEDDVSQQKPIPG